MKKTTRICIVMLLILFSTNVYATNEDKILSSGEKIVAKWDKEIKKGKIDTYDTFKVLRYNIKKTDSLSSPYVLILYFNLDLDEMTIKYTFSKNVWTFAGVAGSEFLSPKMAIYDLVEKHGWDKFPLD